MVAAQGPEFKSHVTALEDDISTAAEYGYMMYYFSASLLCYHVLLPRIRGSNHSISTSLGIAVSAGCVLPLFLRIASALVLMLLPVLLMVTCRTRTLVMNMTDLERLHNL